MAFVTKETVSNIATKPIPQAKSITSIPQKQYESVQPHSSTIRSDEHIYCPSSKTWLSEHAWLNKHIDIEFIKKHDLTGAELHLIYTIFDDMIRNIASNDPKAGMAIKCMKKAIQLYDWLENNEEYDMFNIVFEDLIFCSLCKPFGSNIIYNLPVWTISDNIDIGNVIGSPYGLSEDILVDVINANYQESASSDTILLTEIVTSAWIGEPTIKNICDRQRITDQLSNSVRGLQDIKNIFTNEDTYPEIYKKYYGDTFTRFIKDINDPLKVMEAYFLGCEYDEI